MWRVLNNVSKPQNLTPFLKTFINLFFQFLGQLFIKFNDLGHFLTANVIRFLKMSKIVRFKQKMTKILTFLWVAFFCRYCSILAPNFHKHPKTNRLPESQLENTRLQLGLAGLGCDNQNNSVNLIHQLLINLAIQLI